MTQAEEAVEEMQECDRQTRHWKSHRGEEEEAQNTFPTVQYEPLSRSYEEGWSVFKTERSSLNLPYNIFLNNRQI